MLKWLLALPFAAFILFNAYVYGNIITYRAVAPHQSAFMSMRMSEFRDAGKAVALDYRWVPYQAVSTNLKKALIASEDAKFAEHGGFDWSGIQSAIKRNEKSGKVRAGGSTISQQLAKNLFLSSQRTPWRKGQEAVVTVMLEAVMDKRRIFEIYLNVIEWGDGIFGAEAAARHYFRTSAARLSAPQAARLAAMVPNPRYYDHHPNDRRLARKAAIIVRRMAYADVPR